MKLKNKLIRVCQNGRGTKLGMIKCRTIDIPEFQNYEY